MKSFPTFVCEACEIHYFRLHFGGHLVTRHTVKFFRTCAIRCHISFHVCVNVDVVNDKISCCDIDFAVLTCNTATSNLPTFQRGVSFLLAFFFGWHVVCSVKRNDEDDGLINNMSNADE